MPRIIAKPDTLNEINSNYEQAELKQSVFLNSVPKCGTHLIKNIIRMFVPVSQQYDKEFIQIPILKDHLAAFKNPTPQLSWGHLLFSDESAYAMHNVKQIVVVRDPYDWVLARTRFFLSDSFQGNLEHLKGDEFTLEQIYNMMIFGIYQKAPTLKEIFTHNGVSWLGTGATIVKYEDMIKHLKDIDSDESKHYFHKLLSNCGITPPEDWKERVLVGSDRKQSGTARENLYGQKFDIPNELPNEQKALVDYAAPGLRKLLGYE